jgi:hypothetical protein
VQGSINDIKSNIRVLKEDKRILSIAWIHYQKKSDSVPHSLAGKSIELAGVNSKIFRFCKLSMEKWNTRIHLKTK